MNVDVIRIETRSDGERIGTLVSTQHESKQQSDYLDNKEFNQANLIYAFYNKEVDLFEVDSLPDGDYEITLFSRMYTAAPFVLDGQPTPIVSNKGCYRYIDTQD